MQLVEEIRKERVNGRIVGTFRCYCGNVFKTQAYNVTNGHTRSCGCLLAGKKSSYKAYLLRVHEGTGKKAVKRRIGLNAQ